MIRLHVFNYKFSQHFEPFISLKQLTNLKTCYKPKLKFLKYKISLTNSLSNRLVINSQYYRSYKNVREYYLNFLRANFLKKTLPQYIPYLFSDFNKKEFLVFFKKRQRSKEFDHLLYWRACNFNAMFNVATKTIKKKKKIS